MAVFVKRMDAQALSWNCRTKRSSCKKRSTFSGAAFIVKEDLDRITDFELPSRGRVCIRMRGKGYYICKDRTSPKQAP